MECAKCGKELPGEYKFCPRCGTPVSQGSNIQVEQDIGTIEGGAVAGATMSGGATSGLGVSVGQDVHTVKDGAMVGAVVGDPGSTIHVGGEQHYGDQVQGDKVGHDKNVVNTEGGAYIGGGVNTGGGAFVSRDQIIHGDQVRGDKIGGDKVGGDKVTGDKISISDVSGEAVIAAGRGAQASRTEGVNTAELSQAFAALYAQIHARPPDPDVDEKEITQAVQQIEQEAAKGEEASPRRVERLLKTLALMAPDICKVTAACLANPALGIATAIRKVAEKAQAEAGMV
jgi:hypothetical protein